MAEAEKILIVDDSPINIDFLLEILDGYDVRTALSAYEAETLLRQDVPDLILLDINMPEKDGYAFCKELKAHKQWRTIPVIFLSARNEGEDIVKGFEVGGADYISKPYQNEVVLARIKTQLRLHRMEKRYQSMLRRDDLTGLMKRAIFMQQAEKWLTYAKESKKSVALMAIGVSNLETINRQYGFAAGDEAIKKMAMVLAKYGGKDVMLTRQGGGLFLYLKYGAKKDVLQETGLKIVNGYDELQLENYPSMRIVPEYSVTDDEEANSLYEIIEIALKHLGIFPSYM